MLKTDSVSQFQFFEQQFLIRDRHNYNYESLLPLLIVKYKVVMMHASKRNHIIVKYYHKTLFLQQENQIPANRQPRHEPRPKWSITSG